MANNANTGVLVFKGMKVGFLAGDVTLRVNETGGLESKAIMSTSYNVLPLWLRIASDNVAIAKAAFETIPQRWNDDPDTQRALLMAELTPSIQTFVACGIAYDALYEQLKPFAKISEDEEARWKSNRTSRSARISEVFKRVYKIQNREFKDIRKIVTETMKFRNLAVHPSHELQRSMNRPDIPVGLDWRFCAYRYENASTCYNNAMEVFYYFRKRRPHASQVEEQMGIVFSAMAELGLMQVETASD